MGEYKIAPGEYEVEVSAEGFVTKNGTIVARENEISDLQIYLEPTSENANWYNEHPDEGLILGEIKNYYTIKKVQELKEENPILNDLPITVDYFTDNYAKCVKYTISYRLDDENDDITIMINDYSGGNYNDAIKRLENYGVKKDRYTITYTDETSGSEWGSAE